jgi:hypothetical protein
MSGKSPAGEQSGNYTGVIVAFVIIAVIVLIAAGLWVRYHGL